MQQGLKYALPACGTAYCRADSKFGTVQEMQLVGDEPVNLITLHDD